MDTNKKSFSTEIYPLLVIEKAVVAYAEIADISTSSNGNCCLCTFIKKSIPIQLVIDEFGNYLIELLNNKHDIY